MSRFRPVDRQTGYLLPPSVDEWLPEGHLARFIVEVIDALDLSAFSQAYAGRGSAAYHPSVLLGLLVYGYASGVFSSRKIERATYDSVAFRFIAAGSHPDHDTLATFRLDGTKVKANASRHSALSHGLDVWSKGEPGVVPLRVTGVPDEYAPCTEQAQDKPQACPGQSQGNAEESPRLAQDKPGTGRADSLNPITGFFILALHSFIATILVSCYSTSCASSPFPLYGRSGSPILMLKRR